MIVNKLETYMIYSNNGQFWHIRDVVLEYGDTNIRFLNEGGGLVAFFPYVNTAGLFVSSEL